MKQTIIFLKVICDCFGLVWVNSKSRMSDTCEYPYLIDYIFYFIYLLIWLYIIFNKYDIL